MKKFSRIICLVLVVTAILSVGTFSTSAALAPLEYDRGDVTMDNTINIKDATLVQKYHAGMAEFTEIQLAVSDFNKDEEYNVKDATYIQKYEVGAYKITNLNDFNVHQGIWFQGLYANYDSGKAQVGVPVTFYSKASADPAPKTLEFKINGEVIFERGKADTWEYTFTEAGDYEIEVTLYNLFDWEWSEKMTYTVVEPYETDGLMITGVTFDAIRPDDLRPMTAYAFVKGGNAPYSYFFEITGVDYRGEEITPIASGFSHSSSMYLDECAIRMGEYTLTVIVRDDAGAIATESYDFTVIGAPV